MKPVVKILLLFFFLVILMSGLAIYWTWFKLVPPTGSSIDLDGLQQEVIVSWDEFKVPHISASRESDAFMVTGYIHARDRLWQITRKLYKLEGIHSRELGESLLNYDRFYLTLNFGDIARNTYLQLNNREQALLRAYAEGFNTFLENEKKHLPIEFTLANVEPVAFEPWHAVGIKLLWSWQQQQAFWTKTALSPLHTAGDEDLTSLLTGSPIQHERLFGNEEPLLDSLAHVRLNKQFRDFTKEVYPVQTSFTGTGIALASSSPGPMSVLKINGESGLHLPDQLHEIGMDVNGQLRTGMTIPGFPVIIHGSNSHIAWSMMPLPVDDGDFFSGELFPEPVDEPIDWQTDAEIEERLSEEVGLTRRILTLKSQAEYQLVTMAAHERPIVAISVEDNRYLAFDWPGNHIANDIGSFLQIAHARDINELQEIVRQIEYPALQVLAVSGEGHAGRIAAGRIPEKSHPLKIRSHDDLPVFRDAASLFPPVIRSDGEPLFFIEQVDSDNALHSSIYTTPWNRSSRYQELYSNTSFESLIDQMVTSWSDDTYSGFASDLNHLLIDLLESAPRDSLVDQALPYLRNWDHHYRSNETAATLFELFMLLSAKELYQMYFSAEQISMLFTMPHLPVSALSRLIQQPEAWPDHHTQSFEEWIRDNMIKTVRFLENNYGQEPYDWQWDSVVSHSFEPVFFEAEDSQSLPVKLAERNLFKMNHHVIRGGPHTIQSTHIKTNGMVAMSGASTLKRIMQLSPEAETYSVISTGQSGNIFSRHFDDQNELWNDREFKISPASTDEDDSTEKSIQIFTP